MLYVEGARWQGLTARQRNEVLVSVGNLKLSKAEWRQVYFEAMTDIYFWWNTSIILLIFGIYIGWVDFRKMHDV